MLGKKLPRNTCLAARARARVGKIGGINYSHIVPYLHVNTCASREKDRESMLKAILSPFQAQDSEERERWIRALEDTVVRHNQLRWTASSGRIVGGVVGVKTGGVAGSPLSAGAAATEPATIENFEKKLAEADSYLQLLLGE